MGRFNFFLALFLFFSSIFAQSEKISFVHYTNEDGLPSSYVKSIAQDADGFMWFATRAAVTRFDGQTFKVFPAYNHMGEKVRIFGDKLFLSSDSVLITRTIKRDYYYFDEEKECFFPYTLLNGMGMISSVVPTEGGFWIFRQDRITFLDLSSGMEEPISEKFSDLNIPQDTRFQDLRDENGFLVIVTDDRMLIVIDKKHGRIGKLNVPAELGNGDLSLFLIDTKGRGWLGEYEHGLMVMDLLTGAYRFYSRQLEEPYHIRHNLVHCMTEDHYGRVWIGYEAGLAIHDPLTGFLELHAFNLENPSGLNTNPIYDAFCDSEGNVWLGTYFGGINFWSNRKSFFHIWSSGLGQGQLRGNVVSCLTEDDENNLWIGLEDNGLNKYNKITGEIIHYSTTSGPAHLSYNNLHDLLFVTDDELWIASYTGGINVLNTNTNNIRYLTPENSPGLTSNAIYAFHKVGDSIYIATSLGIVVYDLVSDLFSPLRPEILGVSQFESIAGDYQKLWFSSSGMVYGYIPATDSLFALDQVQQMKNINFVKTDSKGYIWLGDCYQGLCRYNEKSGTVKFFNTATGFPVSWIFSLEEGKDGWFWASSDRGLVKFNPDEDISILYDSNSGIPFNQFNYRASFIDREGNIYFGGNNGMVSFNENRIQSPQQQAPQVLFTGMKLFNEYVSPGDDPVLKKSLNKIDRIVLDYDQNVVTLEFTALAYASKGRCQYAYYLEGFEEKWNYVGTRNFATYTNLSPGTYHFHVKASLGDIQTNYKERVLKIIVRPPIWLSKGAFIGYFVLAFLFSLLVLKVGKNLERSKALLAMERREREHEEEIHKFKLEFFTNISHELKTPLTLILGPLSRLMSQEQMNPAFRKCLAGIERNANRLYVLINQLLEFRKIESGKDQLRVAQHDVREFIETISKAFCDLAEARGIEFVVKLPEQNFQLWFDADKVDKIIVNLLSNAFKFTNDGGKIVLSVELDSRKGKEGDDCWDLMISVSDTGKGIPSEMLDQVFDRFFETGGESNYYVSSGIGLAYVKSLVMFHRGTIQVKSKLGEGSIFTVSLPVSKSDFCETEIVPRIEQYMDWKRCSDELIQSPSPLKSIRAIDPLQTKPSVLVVEDNQELVGFLMEILEDRYQVESALNGKIAMEKLGNFSPDLVISDIMMPEMDGITFTKKLKTDLNTSHIPVILLTSRSGVKNELKGLMTGADYYIEKPFYPDILVQVIENILNNRQRIIDRFRNEDAFSIRDIKCSESDKLFLEKLTALVNDNLNNESLDVSFLTNELGVSRSLLHKKLKSLVGCSATEFIRVIRLKEASKLISSGKCNITEAAYEAGFSSPAYFTRCFKEVYGQSPREYFKS
ncbi:hybrid sensor histidine kinase/response regulator transcription factor [Thermophagus xiamenensis]|uniref:histidine kinase n=1 Tax=Thermophagus xiamenensis TaxID=385682 RepID=A0A1I2FCR3_9BACT|nr:two-component regulator propeller domain-containing protein [Thermophagus xiamenensis]SFF03274.1 Signal transduction histidine kinase [Thermophagus xiamenensis]